MTAERRFTQQDLDLLDRITAVQSRTDFWTFRRYMNPGMRVGWWQREVARELQQFADDFFGGQRPALAIQAPPQHGKSYQVIDLLAWVIGRHTIFPETCGVFRYEPGLREVYGSFSERLGVRANLRLQRIFQSPQFLRVFPGFRLPGRGDNAICNRDIIEIPGREGYFRNTTVGGAITGEGLDLGVVDDPLKGRKDASSPTIRDTAWNWLTDDLFTRFSNFAALLIILTRWHVDDPLGRLKAFAETGNLGMNLRILRYPAIAEVDEEHRKAGDPLFPEFKPLDFLLARKALMLDAHWEALYQQAPYVAKGDIFPIDKFQIVEFVPRGDVAKSVRYWDKAGTKDGVGAETAGVLMHRLRDGTYLVEHVEHGRWAYLEREKKIKHCRDVDGLRVEVYVEQEPGSGGKESADATILNLAGSMAYADRPTGDKALRAEPYAAQVQAGHVKLLRGDWNRQYLEEHQQFPNGKLKDMVDASSGAFSKVAASSYDIAALAS